ncbi:hypothetical protein [Escherichia coli]|uniref:hypothetical protein n=1 Tax=Escherichia coli TaxID=562 RepID=UPI001F371CE3|nr:hypothetical protein [Escherichia coli]MCF6500855.1 hypothetical protein [Escherichia coli]
MLFDSKIWSKNGRGLSFEFYLSDENIAKIIYDFFSFTGLKDTYIMVTYNSLRDSSYIQKYNIITPAEITEYNKKGEWFFLIGIETLTPSSCFTKIKENINATAVCNGLIILQYGRTIRLGVANPTIMITNKVINNITGEVHVHGEYEKIFKLFVKFLKKRKMGNVQRLVQQGKIT